ncbi:MAG: AraC family transcriptional regulator [Hyphomicrobiales bacterium]|nr:AraC family transcriptional regulator [Hyphomicrobiales bacterium]MCP5371024.1 AraC family transcriptional regulator [Hyphomicrobiales bacterium]
MTPSKSEVADKTTPPAPPALPLVDGLAWSGFDRALRRAPGGGEAVFRRIGVPLATIGRPGGAEPLARYAAFFEAGARALDDPLFGLRLGAVTRPARAGLPGYVTVNSPTLAAAAANLGRTLPVLVDGVDITLQRDDDGARVRLSPPVAVDGPGDRFADHSVAFVVSMLRGVMGRRWSPVRVAFRHPAPRQTSLYRLVFGCPVDFGQGGDAVVLDPAQLDRRNTRADRFLLALLLHAADERLAALPRRRDFAAALRAVLADGLARGTPTLDFAAARFGLAPRTLQRHLKARGLGLRALLDQVRLDQARRLLADGDLPVTAIAFRLGYGEVSAFSRAFERWTGQAPSRYRRSAAPR